MATITGRIYNKEGPNQKNIESKIKTDLFVKYKKTLLW
jgi:hypothetical protein